MRTFFCPFLLCLLVISLLSCAGSRTAPLSFPPELPGGFRLSGVTPLPAAEAPEIVRPLGLSRAGRASYRGDSPLTVTVYEMNAASSAFELAQKWRPEPGLLYFHAGARFVTLESPGAAQPLLNEIAKALETHFGGS